MVQSLAVLSPAQEIAKGARRVNGDSMDRMYETDGRENVVRRSCQRVAG